MFEMPAQKRSLTSIVVIGSGLIVLAAALWFALRGGQLSGGVARFARSRPAARASISSHSREVLNRICALNEQYSEDVPYHPRDVRRKDPGALRQVDRGIENVQRLLPVGKKLALDSLKGLAKPYHLDAGELRQAERQIKAVRKVVLEDELRDRAAVDDQNPQEIHVGPAYALYLNRDEDAIFLLGHELTHVAAFEDNLEQFFESTARIAANSAGVSPTDDQKEDLGCDFIGEQSLKRFIRLHPTAESAAKRFSMSFGYDCDAYSDDSDEDHLSEGDTLQALLGLDPDLRQLILDH